MADLRELYQEIILDHYKKPRNFRALESGRKAEGYNPLCGDKITIYLTFDGDRVKDASFQGAGCAISTASASIMTEVLKGKTRSEVEVIFKKFHELVTGQGPVPDAGELGKLAVFSGVREYPVRIKCATLAWHTLKAAIDQADSRVTTE